MAAALECWSGKANTDEDIVEQVLMRGDDRSECPRENDSSIAPASTSGLQKRFQKLGRNVSEAIASLKNTLTLESAPSSYRRILLGGALRSLLQLYPGSNVPDKLVSNIRKHYDALPFSYAEAGFEMKDVVLHMKLMEQASIDEHFACMIQQVQKDDVNADGSLFKLTFACKSEISWPAIAECLESFSISCNKLQIFEKKGLALGVVLLLVETAIEKSFRLQIENALKLAFRKLKGISMKLSFGFRGCQENCRNGSIVDSNLQLNIPLPADSIVVSVDEWQTLVTGGDEIKKWLLNQEILEITNQIGPSTFKGLYKGKKVRIEKLQGCEKGSVFEFKVRKDLLELMTCGHKNILHFHGVYLNESHGLCVVTKLMEGGSVHDMILLKNKKLQTKDAVKILIDIAEGIKFMHDHGICYRDLNTQRILLDKRGHACLGDMGIVSACNSAGEIMDYEIDGYRWLAPEIISGDPENVSETRMSNAYSFGMIMWEILCGEIAYSGYSPVQAAVGIAACDLRPDIPENCPQILRSLMIRCWSSEPSNRPQFSDILTTLSCFSNETL